jgi:sec-independent protein translocase protein TatC
MNDGNAGNELDPRGEMGLLEHLEELRRRLLYSIAAVIVCSLAAYYFAEEIFGFLAKPLLETLPEMQDKMVFTSLPEVFFVHIKVALFSGIVISVPVLFYQVWRFVVYALHKEEKRLFAPFLLLSSLFFITGAVFCYYVVFPWGFRFFLSYSSESIMPMITLKDYFKLVTRLILVFGCIFEMPILSAFLSRLGLLSPDWMRKNRKYTILFTFIIAAFLTPPDAVTQLMLAGPMLVLFEVSIWSAALFRRNQRD